MPNRVRSQPYYRKGHFRIVTTLFGLLLVATGVLAALAPALFGVRWLPAGAVCVVLLAFGLNAIVASYRATKPWVSRIGPI